MNNSDCKFPSKELVWPGSLLGSIAHAIFVARAPLLAHEQSWDGNNYSVQDSEGSRATIAFGEDHRCFVAVFYLLTSARNPIKLAVHDADEATVYVRDVPADIKALSREALQYVLQDIRGTTIPVITAAFWSDPGSPDVTASEPWTDVYANGAVLVKNQLLRPDVALKQWAADFEFTSAQTTLMDVLFKRRLEIAGAQIHLTPTETQQIRHMADGDAGFEACRESFREIGILFP